MYIIDNYKATIAFFTFLSTNRESDGSHSAKAVGFLQNMNSFQFFFLLSIIIEVFEQIEILNTQLQKLDLCVSESHSKVHIVIENLKEMRKSKFQSIWTKCTESAKSLNIDEPVIPRTWKIPKRLDDNSTNFHVFETPEDLYRIQYYEILDKILMALSERFNNETMDILNKFEDFIIGKPGNSVDKITEFYDVSIEREKLEVEIDGEKLVQQRDIFLDTAKRNRIAITSVKDVALYLRSNKPLRSILGEYAKLVRLLLTIPTILLCGV